MKGNIMAKKKVLVLMPDDMAEEIETRAFEGFTSKATVIRQAIAAGLKEQRLNPEKKSLEMK
jgi:hypothetical protein